MACPGSGILYHEGENHYLVVTTMMDGVKDGIKRWGGILAGSKPFRKKVKAVTNLAYEMHIRRVFERYGVDLVLDVGANAGQFVRGLRAFYKGDIISFEPVSAAFGLLSKAAAGDPRWKCYRWALGEENATRAIHVYRQTSLSSFFNANEFAVRRWKDGATDPTEEVVTVRRLDEVLEEVVPDHQARRIFLKMDTQGCDREVFRGLGKQVGRVVALQSEVSVISIYEGMPHWTESVAEYEHSGFGVAGMFPVTLDGCRVIEFDCLMVRASAGGDEAYAPAQSPEAARGWSARDDFGDTSLAIGAQVITRVAYTILGVAILGQYDPLYSARFRQMASSLHIRHIAVTRYLQENKRKACNSKGLIYDRGQRSRTPHLRGGRNENDDLGEGNGYEENLDRGECPSSFRGGNQNVGANDAGAVEF